MMGMDSEIGNTLETKPPRIGDPEPVGAAIEPEKPAKRKPGRPKGYPKTGGRQKGTGNKFSRAIKDEIRIEGQPLQLHYDIVRGRRIKAADPEDPRKSCWLYPTITQRIASANALAAKIAPDLKSQELIGDPEKPIAVTAEPVSDLELGRHVAHLLRRGDPGLVSEETRNSPVPDGFSAAPAPEAPAGPVTTANGFEDSVAPTTAAAEPEAEPVPPAEPAAPPVGSVVYFTGKIPQDMGKVGIVGCAPERAGLPVIFEVRSDRRGLHQRGPWPIVLDHARRLLGLDGDDAWPEWKVEREAQPIAPPRPDERIDFKPATVVRNSRGRSREY